MDDDLRAWRSALRKDLIGRRIAIAKPERDAWNARIDAHIEALLPDVRGRTVGFCWPYKGEHDARKVVLRLRERGARSALPVVVASGMPLEFREWLPASPMEKDAYGFPIPPSASPRVAPDIVLLPMAGFDAHCYRLGYGGGFFDRTLASLDRRPFVIGTSYELARLPTIRPQAHDIAMDCVVTEAGSFFPPGIPPTHGSPA